MANAKKLWLTLTKIKLKPLKKGKKEKAEEIKVNPVEKIKVSPVEEVLKPVDHLDLDDGSDVSEISDVFEELHKNSYLKRQPDHSYFSKHEADIKTFDDFTDEFKNVLQNVRDELKISKELLLDEKEDNILKNVDKNETFRTKVAAENAEVSEDINCRIPTPSVDEESEASSMFWHLLAVQTDSEKFKISPPGFNAFHQSHPHWLQREPVSWQVLDESRLKCENWLQQHCQ